MNNLRIIYFWFSTSFLVYLFREKFPAFSHAKNLREPSREGAWESFPFLLTLEKFSLYRYRSVIVSPIIFQGISYWFSELIYFTEIVSVCVCVWRLSSYS